MAGDVLGTVDIKSASRSAGTLLSQVRALLLVNWLYRQTKPNLEHGSTTENLPKCVGEDALTSSAHKNFEIV
ncbi:hypothetical protein PoB_002130100 [Plakobranchus ocellatus]|uniref:Uncharacterized protein n=1 Tax=Plakobranchus ocellatus TaxID=259542 RepID=A0AAV3ZJL1_9GAST|nr:hypothetical protein PoB_002130100 [Plakobranchus ocellatus]